MALIVETGAGLANADSLASRDAYKAYCDSRGISYADRSDIMIDQDLRKSTDYLGQTYRMLWAGWRVSTTQALDWPRYEVRMIDGPGGRHSCGPYYPSDAVPADVVRACIEAAIRAKAGPLIPDLTQAVKRERAGNVEIEYQDYSVATKTYRAIDNLLAPFLAGGGGIRVVRG